MGDTVGVIGGGASGMMAAITAARAGATVTLLEGNDRLGKKILSTGNGKCNLGNARLDPEAYYTGQPDFLSDCLRRFGTEDTMSFFQGLGLLLKNRNGYLYPACEQAAAVLDVLRHEVRALGIDVVTDCRIEEIAKNDATGSIRLRGANKRFTFDRVVIACGGRAAPKTGSDGGGYRLAKMLGHGLVPTVPALVQLKCKEEYLKAVAGVRAQAQISVYWQGKLAAREQGELQLTEHGISGIPVFQLSRVVNYILAGEVNPGRERGSRREGAVKDFRGRRQGDREVEVKIDFLPDYDEEAFARLIACRKALLGERTVEEFFTGILNKKVMLLFIKLAGLKPTEASGAADERKMEKIYALCKNWRLYVTGSNGYESAQVCAGGVPLDEVTAELESKKAAGVYFAGEILDVDGKCGGYNLQWAWCSGHLAGRAAGRIRG